MVSQAVGSYVWASAVIHTIEIKIPLDGSTPCFDKIMPLLGFSLAHFGYAVTFRKQYFDNPT